MVDPQSYRPEPGAIPEAPGVYRFWDQHGRVVYVGKAKSLRSRLSSYFGDFAGLHPRTQAMVTSACRVDWVTVGTEVEALSLEYEWIKEYDPRFNVRYRDDKSYPYLAVTIGEEFPRAMVMRGSKRGGTRYFGPYTHAWAIRETVDLLVRVFPIRTCSNGVFRRAVREDRPCLLGHLGTCCAPCVGRVDAEEYREVVDGFVGFMEGRTRDVVAGLTDDMAAAAADLDYERAARLRDDLGALTKVLERNAVVLDDGTDADLFGMAIDDLEAVVQVFHVRAGRIRGQRALVVERTDEATPAALMSTLLVQFYGGTPPEPVPASVMVSQDVEDPGQVALWLRERRGGRVELRVPQRGPKRALMAEVVRNAQQALTLHKARRGGDLTTRGQAMSELRDALGLAASPLRIECYDISHLQGTDQVASMVVFEDGLPRKAHYRRFTIRDAADDASALAEAVGRRLRRLTAERMDADSAQHSDLAGAEDALSVSPPRSSFAYPPNLLVVDGGPVQVAAVTEVVREMGLDDIEVCGLAKRLEEVWLPGDPDPVILDRQSEGLYLLQRVRDEAHRFAIAGHRQRRSTRMTASSLERIPGVGESRRRALLRHFGSIRSLRRAGVEEVASVPGIGPSLAAVIVAALAEGAPEAVNVTTGEILAEG